MKNSIGTFSATTKFFPNPLFNSDRTGERYV
jgi:hypothetical protein